MMVKIEKKRKLRVAIIVLIVIALLLILNSFRSGVKNFFYSISSPIQKFFWRIGDSASEFFRGGSLRNEILNLSAKNQELLNQASVLEELKKENEDLRQALEVNLQKDYKLLLAGIVSRNESDGVILIDKGSETGVSENMPVINQNKVLFGRVSEVYKNFSRVVLVTNKGFVSDVKVQGKEIFGVIKGNNTLKLQLDLILKESDLAEDDVLVTSSLEGVFPKNLLVGAVKEIEKEDVKPYQTAQVQPFLDLKNTENLFLITNFKR